MEQKQRTNVIFEIEFGTGGPGAFVVQLYDELCPKYIENFKAFVKGYKGESYKNCHFYNVGSSSISCGDMLNKSSSEVGKKAGGFGIGESIYPDKYGIEKKIPATKAYMLETINMDSTFTIHLWRDELRGQAFGEVIEGSDVCDRIGNLGERFCWIGNCYLAS